MVLTMMAYTGRLRPKEAPLHASDIWKGSAVRYLKYMKGQEGKEICHLSGL